MKKNGFSLTEIAVTVVIVGVMAGAALPQYFKGMEIRKAESVKAQMKLIEANVRYFLDNQADIIAICGAGCNLDKINADFEMDVHNADFDFSIVIEGTPFNFPSAIEPTPFNFPQVKAERNGGAYTLELDVPGEIEDIRCDGVKCTTIGM